MSTMRSGVLACLLCVGLTVSAASDLGYWRLGGVVVNSTSGIALRGYFRWHEYHQPEVAESLPAAIRRWHHNVMELDTALVAVRYPDTLTVVTTAIPVVIPLESIASVAAAPGGLDGREGYNTPLVTVDQAKLLQTRPNAMCWGTLDNGSSVAWLSYDSMVGATDLQALCRPELIGYVRSAPGSNLIRMVFHGD